MYNRFFNLTDQKCLHLSGIRLVLIFSFASGPFNTLKKAEKLVTNCMVDCFDNCPQEIILLMLEKCEAGCMNDGQLDLTSEVCVKCTKETLGENCRGCLEKCAYAKFEQIKQEL